MRCSGLKESEVSVSAGPGSAQASLAKKENRKLSMMVFVGRGTNESNKKHA